MGDTPKERHAKHETRFDELEKAVSTNSSWIWGPDRAPELGAQHRIARLERALARQNNVFLQYVLGPLLTSIVAAVAVIAVAVL